MMELGKSGSLKMTDLELLKKARERLNDAFSLSWESNSIATIQLDRFISDAIEECNRLIESDEL